MKLNKEQDFLLSVRLMTYNQSEFIEDALNGINIQQVNFPFEVVIGDDFSSDDTLIKIKNYCFGNPNIEINILDRKTGDDYYFQRKKKGRLYNFVDILNNCSGKYIALLDGDDFWTDPLKLQKQVDFLEENDEYNICFNRSYLLKDACLVLQEIPMPFDNVPFHYKELLRHSNFMFTASVIFRKPYNSGLPEWLSQMPFGDLALYKIISQDKKIKCINEIMSVYRIHESGVWSLLKPMETKIKYLRFYKEIYFYLNQDEKIIVSDKIRKTLLEVAKLKYPKNAVMNTIYYHYKLLKFNKQAIINNVLPIENLFRS